MPVQPLLCSRQRPLPGPEISHMPLQSHVAGSQVPCSASPSKPLSFGCSHSVLLLLLDNMFVRIIHVIMYCCSLFTFNTAYYFIPSDQIRSIAQLWLTLRNPMNRSTPGLPVHHQLPEFTQTHVHRVSDAIQPSHPLPSPSPPAPNPSQHQSLFQ